MDIMFLGQNWCPLTPGLDPFAQIACAPPPHTHTNTPHLPHKLTLYTHPTSPLHVSTIRSHQSILNATVASAIEFSIIFHNWSSSGWKAHSIYICGYFCVQGYIRHTNGPGRPNWVCTIYYSICKCSQCLLHYFYWYFLLFTTNNRYHNKYHCRSCKFVFMQWCTALLRLYWNQPLSRFSTDVIIIKRVNNK